MIEAELYDGTVLEFPDTTHPQVIQDTVKKQTALRKSAANEQRIIEQSNPTYGNTELQNFGIGFDKVVTDVGRGIQQVTGLGDQQALQDEINESRRLDKPLMETTGGKVGNVAGNVAVVTPALAIPGVNTVTGGIVLGGGLGAAQPTATKDEYGRDTNESRLLNTVLGSAVGGVFNFAAPKVIQALPNIAKSVSGSIQRILNKPKAQVFDETGNFTDDVLGELDKMFKSGQGQQAEAAVKQDLVDQGVLSREQAERFNLFNQYKVPATRFNVTQAADDAVAQQSAIKRSGPTAKVVAEQDKRLAEIAGEGVEKLNPTARDLPEANSRVFGAVDKTVTRVDDEVSKAYGVAREASKGQPRVTFENLAEAVNRNRGSETASGGIISSIRGEMKNKGLVRKGFDFNVNKRGAQVDSAGIKKLTVDEAEELRQHLNSLYSSATPKGRMIIRDLKNAIDQDVEKAVGQDIFKEARAAKSDFQQMIERGRRNKFDKTSRGFLEDVIHNQVPEDKIIQRLLAGRDDDFLKFKEFLTKDAGQDGVQAFNEIKAQVLRDALDRATRTAGKSEGGQAVFNSRLFRDAFANLRQTKKFKELFNADEIKVIDDIVKIGTLRTPLVNTQAGKGPTEMAVDELKQDIIKKIPVIGDKAQALISSLRAARAERRLLQPTKETAKQFRKP